MAEQNNQGQNQQFPPQHQDRQPGVQSEMRPEPRSEKATYISSGKLSGKVALITGGDSGIGRAVAILFAKEGANVAVVYLNEDTDAAETKGLVEKEGVRCLLISGDIGDEDLCRSAVERTVQEFGTIDILVNNVAEQHPQEKIEDISKEQLERTFKANIFSFFYMTKAALPYMKEGCSIINTTSVTSYKGSPQLIDYSTTKGAIRAFTYSLSMNLAERGIRVNAVAPGLIWTPLIPSTFPEDKVSTFGSDVPLKRAGQPEEVAYCYLFLASEMSTYMTGQILHPNGGTVVNG